jgi:hypothetical protein
MTDITKIQKGNISNAKSCIDDMKKKEFQGITKSGSTSGLLSFV